MRYVSIKKVAPKMILAKSIYTEDNKLLLGKNREISSAAINQLKRLGYPGLYIKDEFTENESISDLIPDILKMKAMKAIKEVNITDSIKFSKEIVSELQNVDVLRIELMDLKDFDNYTYTHSVNVAVFSTIIGMGYGLSEKDLGELALAGLLLDIGKTKIPKEILNKKEPLTEEEMKTVKLHSKVGYYMIKDNYLISSVTKNAVLLHHENFDGSGYPKGINGDKLHLFSRIIRIADVYDALVTDRPYKKALTHSEALEYLMSNCGTIFDIKLVEIFLKYIVPYPIGTDVMLSDGSRARVLFNNEGFIARPKVVTLNGRIIDLKEVLNLTITRSIID